MRTFRDLKVWQRAHVLVLSVYQKSEGFPAHERYGLCAQLRRAAISVPANIVEGFKRQGANDFIRFLNIAQASLEETKYLLLLAKDLQYVAEDSHDDLATQADEVGRMLHGLITRVRNGGRLAES